MKRAIWVGVAILVAVAAAVPLWLVLDDGGERTSAALVSGSGPGPGGSIGQLTIAGVKGSPFRVYGYSWEAATSASGPRLGDLQFVRDIDEASPAWFAFASGSTPADSATLELFKVDQSGAPRTLLTYRLTNVFARAYHHTEDQLDVAAIDRLPSETIALRYKGIESRLPEASAAAVPPSALMRMTVSAARATVEILSYEFGFSQPIDEGTGLTTGKIQVDRVVIRHELDVLAPWFAERVTSGSTPGGTTVTIELRRTNTSTGQVEFLASYELMNAVVESVKDFTTVNETAKTSTPRTLPVQEVGLTFEGIRLKAGGASACLAWTGTC